MLGHQPLALRVVVEVVTDAGIIGLGETYDDQHHLERLARGPAGAGVVLSGSLLGTRFEEGRREGLWESGRFASP